MLPHHHIFVPTLSVPIRTIVIEARAAPIVKARAILRREVSLLLLHMRRERLLRKPTPIITREETTTLRRTIATASGPEASSHRRHIRIVSMHWWHIRIIAIAGRDS